MGWKKSLRVETTVCDVEKGNQQTRITPKVLIALKAAGKSTAGSSKIQAEYNLQPRDVNRPKAAGKHHRSSSSLETDEKEYTASVSSCDSETEADDEMETAQQKDIPNVTAEMTEQPKKQPAKELMGKLVQRQLQTIGRISSENCIEQGTSCRDVYT